MGHRYKFISGLHFNLVLCYVLCSTSRSATGQWQDHCSENTDCTQQITSTKTWPCTIHSHDYCTRKRFFQEVPQNELTSEPDNLNIAWYPVYRKESSGERQEFPALNVSVDLDLTTGSEYFKGIHFVVRGMTNYEGVFDYDYFNREICRTFNLSSADTKWAPGDPSKVTFYYDSFCPMSPSVTYEIEIIFLPTSDSGKKKSIKKRYKMPTCKEYPHFYECQSHRDSHDRSDDRSDDRSGDLVPRVAEIEPVYETVVLKFYLPPPDTKLDNFVVSLFKEGNDIKHKNLHRQQEENDLIQTIFNNVSPGVYNFKIKADDVAICRQKTKDDCVVITTDNFTVTANPCKPNPCGHGNCTAYGELYNCTCEYGISQDGKCLDNPCEENPCGYYGNCTPLIEYYNCSCETGHIFVNGTCSDGKSELLESQSQQSQQLLQIILIVVIATLVSAFLILLMRHLRKSQQDTSSNGYNPVQPGRERVNYPSLRILAVYKKDCPQYEKVVVAICRALRMDLGCDVILDVWENAQIVRTGYTAWVCEQFERAEKILFFASKGAKMEWDPLRETHGYRQSYEDAMYTVAMDCMCRDTSEGIRSKRRGKYVLAYFPFSSSNDVPLPLKQFGRPNIYKIPENIESLYIELLGVERCTANVEVTVGNNLAAAKSSDAWKNMMREINAMTEYVKNNPSWYEDIHTPSGEEEQPQRGISLQDCMEMGQRPNGGVSGSQCPLDLHSYHEFVNNLNDHECDI